MHEEIQPLGSRVLVRVLEEESVTRSGIVLPDTAKEKPQRGTQGMTYEIGGGSPDLGP